MLGGTNRTAAMETPAGREPELRPRSVSLSLLVLWGQAFIAIPLALVAIIAYLTDPTGAFGFLALLGVSLYAPPAALCVWAGIGLRRRTLWGRRLALCVHGGLALVLSIPLLSVVFEEPRAVLGLSTSLLASTIFGIWFIGIGLNAASAVALLGRSARAWTLQQRGTAL